MPKKDVICIVGPTASGKTELSIALAGHFGGEIVSADSMQIYKGMDIGTAKPDAEERCGIAHYMMDVCLPSENYSAAQYVKEASCCIEKIFEKGRVPIITGGTGFYIDSLISGIRFAENESSEQIRRRLNGLADSEGGLQLLHERLKQIDPQSADRLHINDKKRIVRAIEVYELTGKTITEHNLITKNTERRYNPTYIGLTASDREILYKRIDRRVDRMLEKGLACEVRGLMESGMLQGTALQAIGYKEMCAALNGEYSIEEAAELIKRRSRNYAKRQLTWFRRNRDIFWINYDRAEDFQRVKSEAIEFLTKRKLKV